MGLAESSYCQYLCQSLYLIPDVTTLILSLAKMQTTATFSSNINRPHPTPDNIKLVPTSLHPSPSLAHGSPLCLFALSSDNNVKFGVDFLRLMCVFPTRFAFPPVPRCFFSVFHWSFLSFLTLSYQHFPELNPCASFLHLKLYFR